MTNLYLCCCVADCKKAMSAYDRLGAVCPSDSRAPADCCENYSGRREPAEQRKEGNFEYADDD